MKPEPCNEERLMQFEAACHIIGEDRFPLGSCEDDEHLAPTCGELLWLVSEARPANALRRERDDWKRRADEAARWLEHYAPGYCAGCDNVHQEPCNECEVVSLAIKSLRAGS